MPSSLASRYPPSGRDRKTASATGNIASAISCITTSHAMTGILLPIPSGSTMSVHVPPGTLSSQIVFRKQETYRLRVHR